VLSCGLWEAAIPTTIFAIGSQSPAHWGFS
jgi:hypothetical protein